MSDVEFAEEPSYRVASPISQRPHFVRLIISWGITADEKQAESILIGVVIVSALVAIGITLFVGKPAKPLPFTPPPPQDIPPGFNPYGPHTSS